MKNELCFMITSFKHINLCLILCLVAFSTALPAQTLVNRTWMQQTGTPDKTIDWQASVLDNNGDILTTSNILTAGQATNILTTKIRATDGTLLWSRNYNHAANDKDYGTTIATDASGNVYVAGVVTTTTDDFDYILLKYSADGAKLWKRTYNGTGGHDVPVAIAVDDSGNIYVTGGSENGTALVDYCTIKYDTDGSLQWVSHYDHNNLYDAPIALEIDLAGNIIVTGVSADNTINWESATIKYDPDTGAQIAENRISQTTGINEPNDFDIDLSGNFYITGKATTDGINYDMRTIKLTADLNMAWVQDYDATGTEDAGTTIDVDDYGNVYVGGYTQNADGTQDALIIKYNSSGTLTSVEVLDNDPTGKVAIGDIKVTNNSILVTGGIEKDGKSEMLVREYDTDNNLLWQHTEKTNNINNYGFGGNILTTGAGATDEGFSVFITGVASNDTTKLMNTIINYTTFERPTDVVTDDEGNPLYMDKMVITKFHKNALVTSTVDNTNIIHGRAANFLTATAISQLNTNLSFDINDAHLIKIFPGFDSRVRYSTNRLGVPVHVPDFWTCFVVVLPESVAPLLGTPQGDVLQVTNELEQVHDVVRYAHPNYVIQQESTQSTTTSVPNDSLYNRQISLHHVPADPISCDTCHINAEPAWDVTTGKDYIRVGIFDSGIQYKHTDLTRVDSSYVVKEGRVMTGPFGVDITTLSNSELAASVHGTKTAGIIGALRDNDKGISGIAGGNNTEGSGISLYSLQVLRQGTLALIGGIVDYTANAITISSLDNSSDMYEYDYGLHIQNHSWSGDMNALLAEGGADGVQLMRDAIHFANRMQVILSVARGNTSSPGDSMRYPACYNDEWVMTVGGSGEKGEWWPFARTGCNIDFAAPADTAFVYTTDSEISFPDGSPFLVRGISYKTFDGTSAATPHVSGLAALMLSQANDSLPNYNNLAPEDVEWIIENTARDMVITDDYGNVISDVGIDDRTGYGLINAAEALRLLRPPFRVVHVSSKFPPTPLTVTLEASNVSLDYQEPYDVDGYPIDDTLYIGDIYKVTATINHNINNDNIVGIWPRHSMSNLFKEGIPVLPNPNAFDLLPHEQIYLDSYTANSATFHGYVYHLKQIGSSDIEDKWIPFDPITQPDSLNFEYSLLLDLQTSVEVIDKEDIGVSIIPNPSNESNTLIMNLPETANIKVELYDMQGRLLGIPHYGILPKGNHQITNDVSELPSGMYMYRITSETWQTADKFIKL